MSCPVCGHENRPAAKFCEECAAPLRRVCASCGVELRPTAKFCDECGTPTTTATAAGAPRDAAPSNTRPAEAAGARKVVTIVFADLVGSTALQERLDAEAARRFMESYYAAMRAAVASQRGSVVKLLGDGVLAVFGTPRVAEDDAPRAVFSAVEMQRAFRELVEGHGGLVGTIGLRVAVNTGEVVASDETELIGDPVNVAARLQEQAGDGDVVIGEATQRLVSTRMTLEPLGSFTLKGRAEPVRAYRVVSLERPAGAAATPFVGREEELARITKVYNDAAGAPAARLAVLVGSPGLGKSRLMDEFTRRQRDQAIVLVAHCEAAGSATFAPLADALREWLAIEDGTGDEALRAAVAAAMPGSGVDHARVVDGVATLLAGSPASPEETFFVVRRLLAALANQRPVVLAIDDLQWAEPLLLDLVEHLVQWGSGVPLLVLIGARPELRDTRSALTTAGGLVADVITLAGLDAGAAMRLAAGVIGAADLPAAVAAKVLATSEGNPLYVGELVRMLVEEGALERQGDRWIIGAGLAELEMPPTIHALLAARIERLRSEERTVLERAAVVGRQFSRSAVAELLPHEVGDLDARLESLRRSELIERDTGWFLGEPVLRFHHSLIRDAAYRRVLKGTRADLHARFADWMESRVGDAIEHDETIGWHLEQAHQHLGELGPLTEQGHALGERAAHRLAAAGRRALARDDVSLAANLLGRAVECLGGDAAMRADLVLDWCEALLAAGEVARATTAIDQLERLAADSARLRAWHTCFAGQLATLTAPEQLHAAAAAVAAAAGQLESLADSAGEAKAHFVHAQTLARLGKVGACEAALDRALAAARSAGDRRRANAVLAGAPLAALWGPSPVTRASGRCLDVVRVLRITQGAPAVEAIALSCQGVLEALRGRTEAARRMLASSRRMAEELGITHRLLETDVFAARINLLEGDAIAAERALRGAYEGLRDLGLGIDAARAGALLARSLLAQDRAAEAEALSHESEALAGDDLQAAIAWRGVRAEALARRGESESAIELAQAAVAIAAATDALLDHADARLALAAALRAAGRDGDAVAEERHAGELWEAKGATFLADRAKRDARREVPGVSIAARRGPPQERSVHRRVRANAATIAIDAVDHAFAGRDNATLSALFSDAYRAVDHTSGEQWSGERAIASIASLMRSPNRYRRHEKLATLGDSLVLGRRYTGVMGSDGGAAEVVADERAEEIVISQVDEDGKLVYDEVFAAVNLADAVNRLYDFYAETLPEGPARARLVTFVRANAELGNILVGAGTGNPFAPTVEFVDHRLVGLGTVRGVQALVRAIRDMSDFVGDASWRSDDVLALNEDAILQRLTNRAVDRFGGGSIERTMITLVSWDGAGLITRLENFEADQQSAALTRFETVTGAERGPEAAGSPGRPFHNAATRLLELRVRPCWRARDWAGYADCLAPAFVCADRRSVARLELDRDDYVEMTRALADVASSALDAELLATRGERLVLARVRVEVAGGDVGPSDLEHLNVWEANGRGDQFVANVRFDGDDLDAAYAELDARYEAGDVAHRSSVRLNRAFVRAVETADWGPVLALCAPTLVEYDHRRLAVLGTTHGAEDWIRNFRLLAELAPDTTMRVDHIEAGARGFLFQMRWQGTQEGGHYEIPVIGVIELDASDRVVRADIYDVEQVMEARARFAELKAAASTPSCFENTAFHSAENFQSCWNHGDWARLAAMLSSEFRFIDRQGFSRLELDGDQFVAFTRQLGDLPSTHSTSRLVASRGDRLALMRTVIRGADDELELGELEHLYLFEIDERDRIVALVRFDSTDEQGAYEELATHYAAGEGAGQQELIWSGEALFAAINRRDWEALRAAIGPDYGTDDRRVLGWGRTLGDTETFVRSQQALVELSPDSRYRIDHVRIAGRVVLMQFLQSGTRAGGAFETPMISVGKWDDAGRPRGSVLYDLEQTDEAFRHFDELRSSVTDPTGPEQASTRLEKPRTHGKPVGQAALELHNAATVVMRRWEIAFESGFARDDWESMRGLCGPTVRFEDRRRFARLDGDGELMVASARERARVGARPEMWVIGAMGDRIALWRMLWSGGPADGRFEVEYVAVTEADESGLIGAIRLYDSDAMRAAKREALVRWASIDPLAEPWVDLVCSLEDGFAARELGGLQATWHEDLVVNDHRRTGLGKIEGFDAYRESLSALLELSPDAQVDLGWYWAAHGRRAALTTIRRTGTIVDGGEHESEYLVLYGMTNGRVSHCEFYEIDALDAARARFDELEATVA